MDDKTLRAMEKIMRGVPNFKPRGHGVVVIYGLDYEPVNEPLSKLLIRTFQTIENKIFLKRLKEYIAECEVCNMNFKSELHRAVFNDMIRKKDNKNNALMSALYLLSADVRLSRITKSCCKGNRISFSSMRLNECSEDGYTLYAAAKDLYLGTRYLSIYDLADKDVVSSETFRLICNAMVIRRFGIKAIQQERNENSDQT